jgi:hypothetical protein
MWIPISFSFSLFIFLDRYQKLPARGVSGHNSLLWSWKEWDLLGKRKRMQPTWPALRKADRSSQNSHILDLPSTPPEDSIIVQIWLLFPRALLPTLSQLGNKKLQARQEVRKGSSLTLGQAGFTFSRWIQIYLYADTCNPPQKKMSSWDCHRKTG